MRYLIQCDIEGNLGLTKVKSSKNNSVAHYKTRRVALKHLNRMAREFNAMAEDLNAEQLAYVRADEQGLSPYDYDRMIGGGSAW